MTIVFVLRNLEGGIRRHVLLLMQGALAAGHSVYLLTDRTQMDKSAQKLLSLNAELSNLVFHVEIRSTPGPLDLISIFKSMRILHRLPERPDVIHGHGAKGGLLARILSRCLQTRSAYTPHGGSIHAMHGWLLNPVYVAVERLLIPFTDRFVFESRYSLMEFFRRVANVADKSALVVNGTPAVEPDLAPWPNTIGTPAAPLAISAFGLLRSIKGFDVLLRAFADLKKSGLSFKASIFGEGSERAKLETLRAELDLTREVSFPGETTDSELEMRRSHVVVQPSRFESFGLVTLEAQALGRAVVASHVGGLEELVDDRINGRSVEPEDFAALASAIRELCFDREATQTMREKAAKSAAQTFSSETMVKQALALYSDMLGAK